MKFKVGDRVRWKQCIPPKSCITCIKEQVGCESAGKSYNIGTITSVHDAGDHYHLETVVNKQTNGWYIDDCFAVFADQKLEEYKKRLLNNV